MRKKMLLIVAGLLTVFVLSACGSKSQESVRKELTDKLEDLSGYKVNAKMTLAMGKTPQVYDVEIWHKDPSYYRVKLKNANKEQSQMILRNDDGVFVLTPALNKSFRFQSDWPKNSSQAYLYESLIRDIVEDKEAKFSASKEYYVFETKTRYQNNQVLPTQEIKLNKDLSPASVKVMDADRNTIVSVKFSKVKFNAKFETDDFETKKNMTRAQIGAPVMAEADQKDTSFAVKYPVAELKGVSLLDQKEISLEDGKRVVLTYGGEKSFTLIQEKRTVETASASYPADVNGEPADLGFTIGALTDHSITWNQDGIDYRIASNQLTKDEMITLARSVQGDLVK
ncbi:outer membrane lipoprotein carrier protein LolA [Neobacillus notoginsengisoli]|uniref:Outer membrane lipoprotein carrier protein LolA n=1 Tax=Neobacillus notoginsengisoli TaxID=1578198 RepID=A0A417YN85_9BACI|nr:outer membrane lipoprotein carrier protein LolA [Neobacillus notoginsengisoli]RHW34870.1 outer membrane lipoprotein carrier protein LolA [Neobacillus notoginsengisoli]